MYNKSAIDRLIKIVEENNGIGDKEKLANMVCQRGNILATKIWIAQVFGIIQIIQILRAKSHKQNCLD